MFLEEEVGRINDILKKMDTLGKNIVWGAAENTVRLFQYTDVARYNISQIVDSNGNGQSFLGYMVKKPDQISWNEVKAVVISSYYHEDEIEKVLLEKYQFKGLILKLNAPGQTKPFYSHLARTQLQTPMEYRHILKRNEKFHNLHQGERIVIIGNGPSIKETDLTRIRDARKMVVHNFYLHKDYEVINPDYYCFAKLNKTEKINDAFYSELISQIGQKSASPQFFFHIADKQLIEQCRDFQDKAVNYMHLANLELELYEDVDITNQMLAGQSVPVDCIQLALYMGFREIYLVGVEHSDILTRQYGYFYDRSESIIGDKDMGVKPNNETTADFRKYLRVYGRLWQQYERLKELAENKGVKIVNATKGGLLDVFERADYDMLF
jgi:hypothetical protein